MCRRPEQPVAPAQLGGRSPVAMKASASVPGLSMRDRTGGCRTVSATSRDPAPGSAGPRRTSRSTYRRSAAWSGQHLFRGSPISRATASHSRTKASRCARLSPPISESCATSIVSTNDAWTHRSSGGSPAVYSVPDATLGVALASGNVPATVRWSPLTRPQERSASWVVPKQTMVTQRTVRSRRP